MLNQEKIQKSKEFNKSLKGFKICGACYKPFILQHGSIYKITYEGKMYNFCCYTCYRNAKKYVEEIRKQKKDKEVTHETKIH